MDGGNIHDGPLTVSRIAKEWRPESALLIAISAIAVSFLFTCGTEQDLNITLENTCPFDLNVRVRPDFTGVPRGVRTLYKESSSTFLTIDRKELETDRLVEWVTEQGSQSVLVSFVVPDEIVEKPIAVVFSFDGQQLAVYYEIRDKLGGSKNGYRIKNGESDKEMNSRHQSDRLIQLIPGATIKGIQQLEELGADLNYTNYGATRRKPLEIAVAEKNYDVAEYMVKKGATVDLVPLPMVWELIEENQVLALELLINGGWDLDRVGASVMANARSSGQKDVIALFQKHGL